MAKRLCSVAECEFPSRKLGMCTKHWAQEYRKRPEVAERLREKHRVENFGITMEQYRAMSEAQKDVCAICGKPNHSGWMLAVDHDHKTGKVRGLLCSNCNRGIGLFKDSSAFLRKAMNYLERS